MGSLSTLPPAGIVTEGWPLKVTGFTRPVATAGPRTRGATVACPIASGAVPKVLSTRMRTAEPGSVTRAIMRAVAFEIFISLRLCWEAPQAATQFAFCANEGDARAASAATERTINPDLVLTITSSSLALAAFPPPEAPRAFALRRFDLPALGEVGLRVTRCEPSGCLFLYGYRNACDLDVDREQRAAGGEVESLPLVAAEGHVGRGGLTMDDAAELLARLVHDVETAAAAGVDVALDVDLHPVGHAGFGAAEIGKDAACLLGERAVRQQVVGANMAAPRVIDVEDALVRREGEPVRADHVVDHKRHRAEIGRHAINARDGDVPLIRRERTARIGEVDRAVGLHDDVVRTEQALAAETVGDDGDAAVRLVARDAAGQVLGRDD